MISSDQMQHLIWDEYDRTMRKMDECDLTIGQEKFPEQRFKREYTVFKIGHLSPGRILELKDKTELPTNSILHIFDNIGHMTEDPLDTPRLEENPFIERETYRKFIYHIRQFNLGGPLKYEDKYIFRQSGLPAHLLKFRQEQGSKFRYLNVLDELPPRRETLTIINHNPLFRVRFFGRLQTYRKFTMIWTSILNTVISLQKFNKHQFLYIPWDTEIYNRNLFIRSRDKLDVSTIKRPESAHYFLMMHLVNFFWADAKTSIFSKIPEDVLDQINLILACGNDPTRYIFYNLRELVKLNYPKNKIYYKFLNQLNMLSLLGRNDTDAKDIIQNNFDATEEKVSDTETVTTIKPNISEHDNNNAGIHDNTTTNTDAPSKYDSLIEKFIHHLDSKIHSPHIRSVHTPVTNEITKSPAPSLTKQELTNLSTAGKLAETTAKDAVKPIKGNDTFTIQETTKEFINNLDAETKDFILKDENLTVNQKKRCLMLASKYKKITLNDTTLDKIITENNDISLDTNPITEDEVMKFGKLSDKSALNSSVLSFDKSYMEKSFNRHLAETLVSFNKYGAYLTDLKVTHENTRMNNFIHYTCKYEDINGKSSTIKFRIPQIERDGRIRIDGKYKILKKQRINLPIVKISDTKVSLASNYNKTLIERNINKAHNYFSYIDSFINSDKSTAVIEFGKCAVNLPLAYDYSSISERYRQVTFTHDKTTWDLWFDYKNRESHFDDMSDNKLSKLTALESQYGTYFGHTEDAWLFIDNTNNVSGISKYNGEIPDWKYTSILSILKLSLKDGASIKSQITEFVNIKILDKMLPVIFLLGFRYGLRKILDYIGVKYVITENRTKVIVSDSSTTTTKSTQAINGSESFIEGMEDFNVYHVIDDLDTLKKYGLCSPRGLYEKDKVLFAQTSYSIYKARAAEFVGKKESDVTYEDVLKFLDECPDRKPFSSRSIFFSFNPKNRYQYVQYGRYQLKLSLTTLKKYATNSPVLCLGRKRTQVSWDEFEKNIEKYKQQALEGSKKQVEEFQYKYILHFAVDCNAIPFDAFEIYEDTNGKVLTSTHIENVRYLDKLDALGLTTDDYIISASAAAVLYGMPITNEDIDICITQDAFTHIKSKLIPGKKDGIHDDMWTDISGKLDINVDSDDRFFNFSKYFNQSVVINGYRFLSWDGLKQFYTELYNLHHAEKYKIRLDWMTEQEDQISESIDDSNAVKYTPSDNDISIRFNDRTIWFNRYPLTHSLIVSGLDYFDCSQYSLADFESPDIYYQILADKGMSTNYLKGITSFFDLFVDGMTYEVLKSMHEPTNVRDLLIRATQMLTTIDHLPPSSRANHRIRGMEQIPALVYNELSRNFAAYQSRRGKANTFSINPDAVFLRIISNASLVASEATNPVQCMKESTYMTYAGSGGRSSDSFVLRDRAFADDDIGIISEATVDNQKVAINAQLSMNSGIENVMGKLQPKSVDQLQPADVLSNAALLFPFSTNDDRINLESLSNKYTF